MSNHYAVGEISRFGNFKGWRIEPEDHGFGSKCHVWKNALTAGYGVLRVDGVLHRAHRYFYENKVGPIPDGLCLDHLCRNRACVNPDHLEPVTRGENVRRGVRQKLSDAQVLEVRSLCVEGVPHREIAARFGITKSYVSKLNCGKSRGSSDG